MDTQTKRAADQSLLTGLLDQAETPQLAPVAVAPASPPTATPTTTTDPRPRATQRTKRPAPPLVRDLYERIGTSVALCFALFIAGLLWWIGAYFSLLFLASLGIKLASYGAWAYLIPAAVTASELFLWPARHKVKPLIVLWLLILAFDIGSTASGCVELLAGRNIKLFTGFTIPDQGVVLTALAIGVGIVCAFGPEKLGKVAAGNLYDLWR